MVVNPLWRDFSVVQSRLAVAEATHELTQVVTGFAGRAGLSVDRYLRIQPEAASLMQSLQRLGSNPGVIAEMDPDELLTWHGEVIRDISREREYANMQSDLVYMEIEGKRLPVGDNGFVYLWHQRPRRGFMAVGRRFPEPDPKGWFPEDQLVSMHGIFQDLRSLSPLTDILVKDSVMLHWTYDQPGFGASFVEREGLSEKTYVAAAVKVLEEARRTYPQHPVTLLGFSMGGALALRVAQERPDLVDQLILIAPGLKPRQLGMMRPVALYFQKLARQIAEGRPVNPPFGFSHRQVLQGMKGVDLNMAIGAFVEVLGEGLLKEGFRFQKRTLVVYNPHDLVLDPEGIQRFFGAGPSNVTFYQYQAALPSGAPDNAHDIYLKPAAQQAVRTFIEEGRDEESLYSKFVRPFDHELERQGFYRSQGKVVKHVTTPPSLY